MASTINTGSIENLLFETLAILIGHYEQYPPEFTPVYTKRKSERNSENIQQMNFLPAATVKEEGDAFKVASMSQSYTVNSKHMTVTQSYEISYEAVSDNRYKEYFPQGNTSIMEALRSTENTFAMAPFNVAFDADYRIGDGKSFMATDHPTQVGTFSNMIGNMQLSEVAIENAIKLMGKIPSQAGLVSQIKPKHLLVYIDEEFTAKRIFGSTYRPDDNNNGINVLNKDGMVPGGVLVSHFMTEAPNSAYLITSAPNALVHWNREGVQVHTHYDDKTLATWNNGFQRYSFVVADPRGAIGIQGV